MDSRAFAEAKEDLATSIDFDVYGDVLTVSAQFLTENMEPSVDLIRAALVEPTFDDVAVERVRGQVLSYINSRQTDPDELAGDAMNAAAYGDHPYGSFDGGTVDSVTALTRDDIVTAWENAIARDRVYVSAVGDITPEQLGTVLDTILGDLREEGGAYPTRCLSAPRPASRSCPSTRRNRWRASVSRA